MMHHSFEHMELEKEVLEKTKLLLKENAKLLIRIPVISDLLLEKYGVNLVSLDAPRHFYIHSAESMRILCDEAGLMINKVDYDSDVFSIWASEEYQKDICLSDVNSHARSREKSLFSKRDIKKFKEEIERLNKNKQSDNAAFYISAA